MALSCNRKEFIYLKMKKFRLIDIAEEAGVSIATVSYVLNNVKTQKVSPETRAKILQIADSHNYKKNTYTSSVNKNNNNWVGIYVGKYDLGIVNSDLLTTISHISKRLLNEGFDSFVINNPYRNNFDNLVAIICLACHDDEVENLAKLHLSPIITVDCLGNGNCSEICHVFKNLNEELFLNDYILITPKPNSKGLANLIITNNPNVKFISNYIQLENLIPTLKNQNVVCGSTNLFNILNARGIMAYKDTFNSELFIQNIINIINEIVNNGKENKFIVHL